jgi:hypothetical protein
MRRYSRSAERRELAWSYFKRGAPVVVVLLLFFGGVYCYIGMRPLNGISIGAMKADLDRELPRGSRADHAFRVLQRRAMHVEAPRHPMHQTTQLTATINNDSYFYRADLEITLTFDGRRGLTDCRVRRLIYARQYRIPYDWTNYAARRNRQTAPIATSSDWELDAYWPYAW